MARRHDPYFTNLRGGIWRFQFCSLHEACASSVHPLHLIPSLAVSSHAQMLSKDARIAELEGGQELVGGGWWKGGGGMGVRGGEGREREQQRETRKWLVEKGSH